MMRPFAAPSSGVVVAALGKMTLHDSLVIAAFTVAGSFIAAGLGWVFLRSVRHRSLQLQLVVIGAATVFTAVAGISVAAHQMFISTHDSTVLAVVLVVSGLTAALASWYLGRAFAASVATICRQAMGLLRPQNELVEAAPVTRELRSLSSELTRVSDELAASRRREQALDAARRELVAWVSHDLRSPIASIRAMSEALEDEVVDDVASVARYHRAIRQESERLGSLVDDLFELSRISAGVVNQGQPFVPLPELFLDVLGAAEPAAAAKGVVVVAPMPDLPSVLVPASDLRRVLHNLLDNAVRHTPTGGTVTLDAVVLGDVVEVSVGDQCGGIPADDLPRVFEVAFRGDVARTRDRAGGGLGLAIARGLVEAHHGSIHVANGGAGCRFVLQLPVVTR
jgi:signal transduction histidine kinase